MYKGFSLIEVLVSLLLITSSLAIFFISYKEYLNICNKELKLDRTVQCFITIKHLVDMNVRKGILQGNGKEDGCSYEYYVEELKSNYRKALSDKEMRKIILYRIFCRINNVPYVWDVTSYEE